MQAEANYESSRVELPPNTRIHRRRETLTLVLSDQELVEESRVGLIGSRSAFHESELYCLQVQMDD